MTDTLTRREFIRRGALLGSASIVLPGTLVRALRAAPSVVKRNLILVELRGGNDGLNTLVPYGMNGGAYYSTFRKTLAVPLPNVLPIDDDLGFNRAIAGMKAHFDAGRLAVIPGVSYASPVFSHEQARAIWASGDPTLATPAGWAGRMLAQFPPEHVARSADIATHLDRILDGSGEFVPVFKNTKQLNFPVDPQHGGDAKARKIAYQAIGAALGGAGGLVGQISETALGSLALSQTFTQIPVFPHAGTYPDSALLLGLKQIAQLVNADLGLRIFHVPIQGFDTHAGQNLNGYHDQRLALVSHGVCALYDDLVAMGRHTDTAIVVYSEFGRTAFQNASQGTDHGSVNVVFVLGGAVAGGLKAPHPPLDVAQLDGNGELKMTADYRDVFGTIAAQWFGAAPGPLFPGHAWSDLGLFA